jgi:hypothetical protein
MAVIRGGCDAELARAEPIARIWFGRKGEPHPAGRRCMQQKEHCFMNQKKKILVEVFSDYI